MDLIYSNEPIGVVKESRELFLLDRNKNVCNDDSQFKYAIDLLKTDLKDALELSIKLFEDLISKTKDNEIKKDSMFFMAVAYTKIRENEKALKCCDNVLAVQPNNHQALKLKKEIEKRRDRDGMVGLALAAGATVVGISAIVALAVGLAKKK